MKKHHPRDAARDAALNTIQRIANRAVCLYAEHNIRVEHRDVLMDLTACHFSGQKLRLDDLLAADDANFLHDVAGINRHLDRETYMLCDGFLPRFALRQKECTP